MQLLKVARRSGAVAARLTSQQAMQLLKVAKRSGTVATGPTSQRTTMPLSMRPQTTMRLSMAARRPTITSRRRTTSCSSYVP